MIVVKTDETKVNFQVPQSKTMFGTIKRRKIPRNYTLSNSQSNTDNFAIQYCFSKVVRQKTR
jgi:hypothetical protein